MSQPPGFVDPNYSTHICHLHKALYGLKQAPRAWYHMLSCFLLQHGFTNSKIDTSLFFKLNAKSIIILLINVDDIIITSSNSQQVDSLLQEFGKEFAIIDLGSLHFFLGIEATRLSSGLFSS